MGLMKSVGGWPTCVRMTAWRPKLCTARHKGHVLLLLMTAYTFNAMDRTIISIIGQSMKLDLRLTDTELGLLGGTAFIALPEARVLMKSIRGVFRAGWYPVDLV